jgi:hypothetical protein
VAASNTAVGHLILEPLAPLVAIEDIVADGFSTSIDLAKVSTACLLGLKRWLAAKFHNIRVTQAVAEFGCDSM